MNRRKTTFLILVLMLFVSVASGQAQAQSLYLRWVGVVDNGEGDDWPHGPLGNLHVTVYNAGGRELQSFIIKGPSSGEFLDGDQARYGNAYLGTIGRHGRAIRVRIWESDPGRGHDTLFDAWINGRGHFRSNRPARSDAIRNAVRRGANGWVSRVWNGGIRRGVPSMFVEIGSR